MARGDTLCQRFVPTAGTPAAFNSSRSLNRNLGSRLVQLTDPTSTPVTSKRFSPCALRGLSTTRRTCAPEATTRYFLCSIGATKLVKASQRLAPVPTFICVKETPACVTGLLWSSFRKTGSAGPPVEQRAKSRRFVKLCTKASPSGVTEVTRGVMGPLSPRPSGTRSGSPPQVCEDREKRCK